MMQYKNDRLILWFSVAFFSCRQNLYKGLVAATRWIKKGHMNALYMQKRIQKFVKPLSANPTKWSNTLKQFVGYLPTNCLSVFDHFAKLGL